MIKYEDASHLFLSETIWIFGLSRDNNKQNGKVLDNLVEFSEYVKTDKGYTKTYSNCSCGCADSTVVIEHLPNYREPFYFLKVTANIGYPDYESHPRRECEGSMRHTWYSTLHDLKLAGAVFDDDYGDISYPKIKNIEYEEEEDPTENITYNEPVSTYEMEQLKSRVKVLEDEMDKLLAIPPEMMG